MTDYTLEAAQTNDADKLRKLVQNCHRDLQRAEAHIESIEAEDIATEREAAQSDAELKKAQAVRVQVATKAIRALAKLLPKAIAQANAGKPALLRLILRATK